MTALGTDAPTVAALVYVAAFGLDEGESLGALLGGGPPSPALRHLIVDDQGFDWLPEDDFVVRSCTRNLFTLATELAFGLSWEGSLFDLGISRGNRNPD